MQTCDSFNFFIHINVSFQGVFIFVFTFNVIRVDLIVSNHVKIDIRVLIFNVRIADAQVISTE